MASTRTLKQTVQWAQTLTQMVPIIGVAGFINEPALTICNNVLQEMIQKPYNWKFNSVDGPTFFTVANFGTGTTPCAQPTPNCPAPCTGLTCIPTTDYPQNVTNCAWVEAAWRINNLSTATPQPLENLEVVRVLRPTSATSNPQKLAWMYENSTGGIIRLWPMPSISMQWQIGWTYQQKVPIKASLDETWSPFPDELQWVYNKGFLAMAYKHANDPRYNEAYAEFKAAILQVGGFEDSEGNAEGFQPDYGLFIG
jgi:hypothetical protein